MRSHLKIVSVLATRRKWLNLKRKLRHNSIITSFIIFTHLQFNISNTLMWILLVSWFKISITAAPEQHLSNLVYGILSVPWLALSVKNRQKHLRLTNKSKCSSINCRANQRFTFNWTAPKTSRDRPTRQLPDVRASSAYQEHKLSSNTERAMCCSASQQKAAATNLAGGCVGK